MRTAKLSVQLQRALDAILDHVRWRRAGNTLVDAGALACLQDVVVWVVLGKRDYSQRITANMQDFWFRIHINSLLHHI